MSTPKDPVKREVWICKLREAAKKSSPRLAQDPEWRRKQKEGSQRRSQKSEYKYNHKEGCQNKNKEFYKTTKWKSNIKKGALKRAQDPEWRRKIKEHLQNLAQDLECRVRRRETKLGGFWYGNVRYDDPIYCELWCPELWHRIDEAQNYQSILSGKTKFENGGRALSRHHVYYQPKACCEWDEDTGGYYATINTGTRGRPNWYKHYINGNPNKFVLLTRREHNIIRKEKLRWIKIFEELIETKLGGICYIPKEQTVIEE